MKMIIGRRLKLYAIYFPIILVSLQVLANLLYFVKEDWYYESSFYLNWAIGTNGGFAIFLLILVYWLPLCSVSRWAAWAEVLFAVYYLVIQKDDLYNILFQITVGVFAIILTFWHYIKKFPLCRLSLLVDFIRSVVIKRSCEKGIEKWKGNIIKHYHATTRL